MAMLNARCRTCGTVFPSGIVVENSVNITMSGVTAGPCPRCGGNGPLIMNNTTFDVLNERVTVTRGRVAPELLAVAASTFAAFRERQENREEVEAQIAEAFPQLSETARRLPAEAFLALVTALLALLSFWQERPVSQKEMATAVAHLAQEVERQADYTLLEVFKAYDSGKQSIHGLRNKIVKFFPELKAFIWDLPFPLLVSTVSLIIGALQRWRPIKAKDFKGLTKEQGDELIVEIKAMRETLEKSKGV